MTKSWNDNPDPIADIKNAIATIKDKTKESLLKSAEDEKLWREMINARLKRIFDENIQP